MTIQTLLLVLQLLIVTFGGAYSYGVLNGKLDAIDANVHRINGTVGDLDDRVRFLEIGRK